MRIALASTAALSAITVALAGVIAPVSAAPPSGSSEWGNVQKMTEQELFTLFEVAPDGSAIATSATHPPMGCYDPGAHCDMSAYAAVSTRQPGDTWTDGRLPGGLFPWAAAFDSDSNGWALSATDERSMLVSARPAGGSWGPAEGLPWPATLTERVSWHLMVSESGTPHVWFLAYDGAGTTLHLATRTATGWSTTSRPLSPTADLIPGPNGGVRVAWVRTSGDGRNAIVVSELRPDGTWGPDSSVTDTSKPVGRLEWAGPRALVLRTGRYDGDLLVLGQSRHGAWDRSLTDLGPAEFVATSTGGDQTTVGWSTEDAVRVTDLRGDGDWSRPVVLGRNLALKAVQLDARGNATVVWTDRNAPEGLHSARRPVNGTWTRSRPLPELLSWGDFDGSVVTGVDAQGTVTVGASAPTSGHALYTADLSTPVAVTAIDRVPTHGWAKRTRFPIGWTTTWLDATSHDVRYTVQKITGGPAKPHRLATGRQSDRTVLRGKPGRIYCLSARAHHGATTGPWGQERCVATPLDDHTLKAQGRWSRTKGLSTTHKRGSTLTSPRITGSRFALLVRPSAGAGTVRVHLGHHTLGTYRLPKGKTTRSTVVDLGGFKQARRGQLKIEVVTSGKPVRIDGIYAR